MTIQSLTNGSTDIITDNRNATSSLGNYTEGIGPSSNITYDGASMSMTIFYYVIFNCHLLCYMRNAY